MSRATSGPRASRRYSLFEVTVLPSGRKSYRQIAYQAFTLDKARQIFQSALLAPYLSDPILKPRELRPVKLPRGTGD